MPKVHHVKKARKAIPHAGIKVGDSYYWWKFRYGGKRVSKTYPKPSQLTQSEFYSTLLSIEEALDVSDLESAVDNLDTAASDVRELGDEQEAKKENMPESLQYSPTAELLESRALACSDLADEIERVRDELETKLEEFHDACETGLSEHEEADRESEIESWLAGEIDGLSWSIE